MVFVKFRVFRGFNFCFRDERIDRVSTGILQADDLKQKRPQNNDDSLRRSVAATRMKTFLSSLHRAAAQEPFWAKDG